MPRSPTPILLTVLAAVAAPAASAQYAPADLCVIAFTPGPDFSTLAISADQNATADELRRIANETDTDANGMITVAEVARYESDHRNWTQDGSGVARTMRLDGRVPDNITYGPQLKNFTGPTNATGGQILANWTGYRFDVEPGPTHRLVGGLENVPTNVAVELVVFSAPLGWLVEAVNQTRYHAPTVSIPRFDTHAYFSVDYVRDDGTTTAKPTPTPPTSSTGEGFLPSAGPALALLALAGAALARRR